MRFDIVSLFPEMFAAVCAHGVTGRMFRNGGAQAAFWNPRDYAADRHRTTDDRPFGGGSGMVMKPEPVAAAIRAAKTAAEAAANGKKIPVIFMSPSGEKLDDARARTMAEWDGMILLCGRYRGVDARILEGEGALVDLEVSVGDYVLTGGELAAMALMDSVLRHIDGALGNPDSREEESFAGSGGLLDAPCYTRPEIFEGVSAPEVLLSGDHKAIAKWRESAAIHRTEKNRPDLLKKWREKHGGK